MVTSQVLSSGVDWITVTYPSYELPEFVQDVCFITLERLVAEGSKPYLQSLYGYSGTKIGQLFFGTGKSGSIVQVSGNLADKLWVQLSGNNGKCTRIDLRVDVLLGIDTPTLALRHAEESRVYRDANKKNWKIRYIDGYGAGDTTYTGSFQSLSFGRVYDKWRESKLDQYRNVWRYEVVYRKDYANSIFTQLQNASSWRKSSGDTIHQYFSSRGIVPLYNVIEPNALVPTSQEIPADSKRLQWLEDTVKPMIQGLAARGHFDAVKRIIDLETLERYTSHSFNRKPNGGNNANSGNASGNAGSS